MNAKAAEQRIKVLEIQNKRLSEKVDVQKSELAQRQKTIETHEKRWRDAQAAVLAVRRGWTQLHEDMREIAQRAGFAGNDVDTPEAAPFFDALLKTLLSTGIERTNTEDEMEECEARTHAEETAKLAEEADIAIKTQAEGTARMLASLVEKMRTEDREAAEAAVGEVDEMKAAIRAMRERVQLTQDTLTRREAELKETRGHLSDAQIDLEAAQRKILSYKNSTPKETPQSKLQSAAAAEGKSEDRAANKAVQNLCVESLIQSKIEELERERKEHQKTQKELKSLQLGMKSDSWVQETQLYRSLLEEKLQLACAKERKNGEVERLQSLLDAVRASSSKSSNDPKTRLQDIASLKEAHKKLRELQQQIMENEKAHQSRPPPNVDNSTAEEYGRLLSCCRAESTRLQKRLKDCVWDTERVQKARDEAIEAAKRMRSAESRMEHLADISKEFEDAKRQMKAREEQLLENRDDLQVFVDVLMTYDSVSKNRKEADAVARERNTERKNASLKRKIEELEKACGNEDLQREAEVSRKRYKRLKEKMEQMHMALEEASRISKHRDEDLQQQKQLNTYLQEELEQTGTAYEESQVQNEKLLKQLGEKDTAISHLKQEKAKTMSRVGVLTSLVDNLESKLSWDMTESDEMCKIRADYTARLEELAGKNTQLTDKMDELRKEVDEARCVASKQEVEKQELQKQLDVAERECEEQRKATGAEIDRSIHECAERQKMEADVKAFEDLKRKLRSGTLTKGDVHQEEEMGLLNQEVESLRRTLNCSVCSTRRKSVILMKCLHTFCKPCIENRIDTRSRRCPGCGTAFSREEVRDFFLT